MTWGDISSEDVPSGWSWSWSMPTPRTSWGLQVKAPRAQFPWQGSPLIPGFKSELELSLLPALLTHSSSHGSNRSSCRVSGSLVHTPFPDSLSSSEMLHMVTLTHTQRCYFPGFPSEISDLPKYICSFFLSAKHRPMR